MNSRTTTAIRKRRNWSMVNFGKFRGKTIPEIMFEDPDYLFWAQSEGVFSKRGDLADESEEVCEKARRIRIPDNGNDKQSVRYVIDRKTKKFDHLEFVGEDRRALNKPGSIIRTVIDLSVPRSLSAFDKTGAAQLVADLKLAVFGSASYEITPEECAAFFEDDDNFVL